MNIKLIIRRMKSAYSVDENKELAQKLGITNPAISQALRNNAISIVHIAKCHHDTGADYHWLMTGENLVKIGQKEGANAALRIVANIGVLNDKAISSIQELLTHKFTDANEQHYHHQQQNLDLTGS